MKHFCAGLVLISAGAALLSSCGNEEIFRVGDDSSGAIRLSLAADGGVYRSTRADDTKATIVPDVADFRISLTRTDGSFSQKWSGVEAFNKEELFPIGEYKLEAEYGDADKDGFTAPHYYASETVSVTAGDNKNVSLTASLANSMVSIRYTDDFKNNFTAYSAAVRSSGRDYVVFAQNEDRPAYMAPTQLELSLTLTNSSGKQVTIQPAGFTAAPRRHYIVTIGVNGASSAGNLSLSVEFEENVVHETVEVPLGDELFEAPAPVVTARDFTDGETLSAFESFSPSGNPRFEVYAFGGLKAVTLSLNQSSPYTPPFGKEIQLVGASDLDQANAVAAGLSVTGLFRNPDKMGIVGIKGLLGKLPVGSHTVTLVATDALTRVSEPVRLHVEVSSVDIRIEQVEDMEYSGTEAQVMLYVNNPDVRDKISFKVTNNAVAAEVLEVTAEGGDASSGGYRYRYRLRTPALKMATSPLWAYYGDEADPRANTRLAVVFPKYEVAVDPFAKKVKLKVIAEDPEKLSLITNDLVIISNGRMVDVNRIQKNLVEGIINVFDLTENTVYSNVEFALSNSSNPTTAVPPFTTESTPQVPNGSFSEEMNTVSIARIQVGGKYKVSPTDYTISSSISRNEPVGWASVNARTCYSGASNLNSWFVVPSTFTENGMAVLRSVGYSHNGSTPAPSGGLFNTTYYCTNTPAESDLEKCAGELFLGSYSFDSDGEHRVDGMSFSSRPLTLTFKYRYEPYNNESGEAYVKVFNSEGREISQGILRMQASDQMRQATIVLDIYDFGEKASSIQLGFKSSASTIRVPAINIPTGSALNEGIRLGNATKGANDYKAFAKGSELVIDDVALGYDPPATMRPVQKKLKPTKR